MKKIRFLSLMLPLLLMAGIAFAQTKVITGKVVDQSTGKPLGGVSILGNKAKAGASSKSDGTYSIPVEQGTTSLTFSFIGYGSKTISIEGKSVIDISLVPTATVENEVVVIGYGTQKKSSVTGAVSKISSKGLDEIPVTRADLALQGKLAGVQIQTVDASAGMAPRIQIRGAASINASTNPLIVIDGYPVPTDLSAIDMNEVQSIEVLKDAASAAIYGSRGANGVILITTKSGSSGKTKVSFNAYNGISSVYKRISAFPSVNDWAKTAAADNNGVLSNEILTAQRFNTYTDPQDVIFQQGSAQNYEVNVRGGNAAGTRFFIAGSAQQTKGVVVTNKYDRYSLRSNLDFKISPKFEAGININPSYAVRRDLAVPIYEALRTVASYAPLYQNDSTSYYTGLPVGSIVNPRDFDPNKNPYYKTFGLPSLSPSSDNNGLLQLLNESDIDYQFRTITNAYLKYNITKDLSFRTSFGGFVSQDEYETFRKSTAKKDPILDGPTASIASTFGENQKKNVYDLLNENILNYKKKFGKHDIDAIAGFTAQTTQYKNSDIQAGGFLTDEITTLNAGTISSATTTKEENNLESYLFRINYAYNDKYLLSVSSRWDGSSRFGANNKWGYFPAFSVGWIISKENFMVNSKLFNELKIRGSYGATGNNSIGNYTSFAVANPVAAILGGNLTPGFNVTSYGNPNLTWERTFSSNFGFDAGFLDNRIQLTMDYYNSITDKLLLFLPIPSITGYDGFYTNQGKVSNQGLEYELTVRPISKPNFNWSITTVGSTLKNTLKNFGGVQQLISPGDPKRPNFFLAKVGSPLVQFYGYQMDSVVSIRGSNYWPIGVAAERVFAKDQNKDGIIDANDMVTLGTPYPKFTWGLTNEFRYKNFDLSFVLQGSHGAKVLNIDPDYYENEFSSTGSKAYLAYSPDLQAKTVFKSESTYDVQDASFVALRSLNVGYSFSKPVLKKMGMSNLRIYCTTNNLWYHMAKDYTSYNPEGISSQINGVDATPLQFGYQRGASPLTRTIAFGINAEF